MPGMSVAFVQEKRLRTVQSRKEEVEEKEMKSVLRSAKPYWIYLILTGKKTVEVGKDFPKSGDWNRVVEMYCSKDKRSFNRIPEKDRELVSKYLGKVACRFECDKIDTFTPTEHGICINRFYSLYESCLSAKEMREYANGNTLYGWHISDLKIYDKPKPIMQFYKPCPIKLGFKNCPGCEFYSTDTGCCMNNVTRPPQSWCYVEE